ncbi:MAG: phosphopantetheine-binding protein [bacterium]|nr:phosphopantetheine-binding protein [bacterium]
MANQDVMQKVVEILSPYAKDKEALAAANVDTKILTDLKVNSSRLVDVILAFEDEFDIEIGDDDAREVQTVGKAADMISGMLTKQAG